jgi:hypothetical protein
MTKHLAHIGIDLLQGISSTGSISGELLGEPSAELRAELAGSKQPRLFTPLFCSM